MSIGQQPWTRRAYEQPVFHSTLLGPLELVSGGTAQIVTVAQAKAWSKITQNAEDSVINDIIEAATRYVERQANRHLRPAVYNVPVVGFWQDILRLPKPPLVSVASITYYDTGGRLQTLDSSIYVVKTPTNAPGYIYREPLQYWPIPQPRPYPVTIQFSCGYATSDVVPQTYKQAIYLLCGDWFYNREAMAAGVPGAEIAFGVTTLIESEDFGSYA